MKVRYIPLILALFTIMPSNSKALTSEEDLAAFKVNSGIKLRAPLVDCLSSEEAQKCGNIYVEGAGSSLDIIHNNLEEQKKSLADKNLELHRLINLSNGRNFYMGDYKLEGPKILGAPIRKIVGHTAYNAEKNTEVVDSFTIYANLGSKEDTYDDAFISRLHEALVKTYGEETSQNNSEKSWTWGAGKEPKLTVKYNGEIIFSLKDELSLEYKNTLRTKILEIQSEGKPPGPIKISPTLQ
jgi:hypothetical protein